MILEHFSVWWEDGLGKMKNSFTQSPNPEIAP